MEEPKNNPYGKFGRAKAKDRSRKGSKITVTENTRESWKYGGGRPLLLIDTGRRSGRRKPKLNFGLQRC